MSCSQPQVKQGHHHTMAGGSAGYMSTAVTSHLTHGGLNATGVKLQNKQSQSVSIVKRQGTLATVSRTQAITIPKPVIKFSSGRVCLIYVCLSFDRCFCEQYTNILYWCRHVSRHFLLEDVSAKLGREGIARKLCITTCVLCKSVLVQMMDGNRSLMCLYVHLYLLVIPVYGLKLKKSKLSLICMLF